MRLWVLFIFPLVLACGTLSSPTKKALLYPEYVARRGVSETKEPLADVRFQTGYADDPVSTYAPTMVFYDAIAYDRSPSITHRGWISISPNHDDVSLRIFTRNITDDDFRELKGFTGSITSAIPNEIRFFDAPGDLQAPLYLPISNFLKVFNDFGLSDGDLILLELHRRSTGETDRCLFQYRAYGFNGKVSYQLLFRMPVPGIQPASEIEVGSPYIALSYALGYRYRTEQPVPKWFSDRVAVLFSLGLGSTNIYQSGVPVGEQVVGAWGDLLLGTGIEVMDFVSINLLVNPSASVETGIEAPWAVAVGFDATQFLRFTRGLGRRLFLDNRLDQPPHRGQTPGESD